MIFRWFTTIGALPLIMFGIMDKEFTTLITGIVMAIAAVIFWAIYYESIEDAKKAHANNHGILRNPTNQIPK